MQLFLWWTPNIESNVLEIPKKLISIFGAPMQNRSLDFVMPTGQEGLFFQLLPYAC